MIKVFLHVPSVERVTRVHAYWDRTFATSVASPVTFLEITEARIFVLKVKWPQEDKVFKTPKEGKFKVKVKLEEDKLPRTTASMHFMADMSMRMCAMW